MLDGDFSFVKIYLPCFTRDIKWAFNGQGCLFIFKYFVLNNVVFDIKKGVFVNVRRQKLQELDLEDLRFSKHLETASFEKLRYIS